MLQVSALGAIGWVPFTVLAVLVGVGLGTAIIAGIGLLLLVGAVYVLYALGAFEVARVDGLYNLNVAPLRLRRQSQPGFGAWIRSLGSQLADGRMWTAVADFLITGVIGTALIGLLQFSIRAMAVGVTHWFNPQGEAITDGMPWVNFDIHGMTGLVANPVGAPIAAVFAVGAAVGLVYLARVINIAIVGSSAKSAALAQQTQEARAQASQESLRAQTEAARAQAAADQAQADLLRREGAIRAADVERSRIERDLHDGIQPRLVAVGMTLGLARQQIDTDPQAAKALVAEAHTSTKAAITELRQLARGIHASVLDDRGLDAALSALASRSPVPVVLDVRLNGPDGRPVARVNREAETAVYFVVAESLTNAAKHSRAEDVRVTVRLGPNTRGPGSVLLATVQDNGAGGAQVIPGGGLDGVINRVTAAGGEVRLTSPAGGPTTLEVFVPCEF